jgi:hypothetical protein
MKTLRRYAARATLVVLLPLAFVADSATKCARVILETYREAAETFRDCWEVTAR